jgi:hypothetical protein
MAGGREVLDCESGVSTPCGVNCAKQLRAGATTTMPINNPHQRAGRLVQLERMQRGRFQRENNVNPNLIRPYYALRQNSLEEIISTKSTFKRGQLYNPVGSLPAISADMVHFLCLRRLQGKALAAFYPSFLASDCLNPKIRPFTSGPTEPKAKSRKARSSFPDPRPQAVIIRHPQPTELELHYLLNNQTHTADQLYLHAQVGNACHLSIAFFIDGVLSIGVFFALIRILRMSSARQC